MEKQWRVIVFGAVQGVNLRYETCQSANRLKLYGFVRNLPDGSVEIMAQGEEVNLRMLVDWLRSSPGSSQIDKLVKEEVQLSREFDGFGILY